MSGPLSMEMSGDVRVCARCGTRIVTLASAIRMIWADVTDDTITADAVEEITAPVIGVWADVLCGPLCPPDSHQPSTATPASVPPEPSWSLRGSATARTAREGGGTP